jgi:hypothetical protein
MQQIANPRNGVTNVLSTLPCGNTILLFFSASHQLRGHQVIDEINSVNYVTSNSTSTNYNDDYKKFAEQHGLQRRLKETMKNMA